MRAFNKCLFLLGLIVSTSVSARGDDQYYAAAISRAPSLDGMTGLLTMNLPHTMGAGITAVGAVSLADSLPGQYEDLTEAIVALRVGFSDNIEIGLKTKNYTSKDLTGNTNTGLGDAEVMIKWKFREQNEHLLAMALGLGAILPTADEKKGFGEVDTLGIKLNVTGAAEKPIYDDSYVGLYFEGEIVAIDSMTSSSPYKEMYAVVNVGLAFPISDDNNLSFFTELNRVTNKDKPTMVRNHSAITPGLRYANDNFNLTIAAQMIDYGDINASQNRFIAQLSLGF